MHGEIEEDEDEEEEGGQSNFLRKDCNFEFIANVSWEGTLTAESKDTT